MPRKHGIYLYEFSKIGAVLEDSAAVHVGNFEMNGNTIVANTGGIVLDGTTKNRFEPDPCFYELGYDLQWNNIVTLGHFQFNNNVFQGSGTGISVISSGVPFSSRLESLFNTIAFT